MGCGLQSLSFGFGNGEGKLKNLERGRVRVFNLSFCGRGFREMVGYATKLVPTAVPPYQTSLEPSIVLDWDWDALVDSLMCG